jgi:hypothetical protein
MPKVTNEVEASEAAGFEVKFPCIQPDYQLQLAVVDALSDGGKYVWLFYSENPIPDGMTVNQFWADGGITINYHKEITVDAGSYALNFLHSIEMSGKDAHGANINGHYGVAISELYRVFQGVDVHDPAHVDFTTGITYVSLQAYMDTEGLTEVAKTMPFSEHHHH